MKNDKYLFIIPSLGKGGAEKSAIVLASYLSEIGCDVTILTFSNSVDYTVPKKVEYITLDQCRNLGLYMKVRNLYLRVKAIKEVCRSTSYNYVISYMDGANLAVALSGCSFFATVHNNPNYLYSNRFQALIYKWVYKKKNVKKIGCVSREIVSDLELRFDNDKFTYVPNPVSITEIENKSKEKYDLLDKPYILSVGRLQKQKNYQMLIDAFRTSKLFERYDLVLLGDGSERESLELKNKDLIDSNSLRLPGIVENPYSYMRNCEFYVQSSVHEGFGIAILEALALGVITLSTDCDYGPRELIDDRVNGFLCNIDMHSLSKALIEVANIDEKTKRDIINEAKKRASIFSPKNIIRKLIDEDMHNQ